MGRAHLEWNNDFVVVAVVCLYANLYVSVSNFRGPYAARQQFTWINKQNKVNYDLADYIRQFTSRQPETFNMMQRTLRCSFQVEHHPKQIPWPTSSHWLI